MSGANCQRALQLEGVEGTIIIGAGGGGGMSFEVQENVLSQHIVLNDKCSSNSNKIRVSISKSTDKNTPKTIGSKITLIGTSTQIHSTFSRDEVQNEDLGFMPDITIMLCCTILQ